MSLFGLSHWSLLGSASDPVTLINGGVLCLFLFMSFIRGLCVVPTTVGDELKWHPLGSDQHEFFRTSVFLFPSLISLIHHSTVHLILSPDMEATEAISHTNNVWTDKYFAVSMGSILVLFIVSHWGNVAFRKYGPKEPGKLLVLTIRTHRQVLKKPGMSITDSM
jgi:hypothetical protein